MIGLKEVVLSVVLVAVVPREAEGPVSEVGLRMASVIAAGPGTG